MKINKSKEKKSIDVYYNDSCPICLEKFIIFTGDIGNLVFYGSDPVVTRIFGTNIKYAIKT